MKEIYDYMKEIYDYMKEIYDYMKEIYDFNLSLIINLFLNLVRNGIQSKNELK